MIKAAGNIVMTAAYLGAILFTGCAGELDSKNRKKIQQINDFFFDDYKFIAKDKHIGWKLRNNFQVKHRGQYYIKTNGQGFRSNTEIRKDPEDNVRIICLGDSAVFGLFCNQEDTFPAILENKLLKIDPKYQVINAGVPAYRIEQAFSYYRQVLKAYRPKLVILYIGCNDINHKHIINPFLTGKLFDKNMIKQEYENLVKEIMKNSDLIICTLATWERVKQLDELNDIIRQVGMERNVSVLDVWKRFHEEEEIDLYSKEDQKVGFYYHPNSKGNELIASMLLPLIVKKNF